MPRLSYVIRKEFTQIRRDPMTIRLIMVTPVIQLIFFGYAVTNDVRDVPVAVYDADRTAVSRSMIEDIAHSEYFDLVPAPDDPRALEDMLLRGRAQIALRIPKDMHRDLMRGGTAHVGLYVDGTDSNTAGVAGAYLARMLAKRGAELQVERLRSEGAFGVSTPSLQVEPRVWYNVELKSVNYMVPGVFGLILLVLTVNLASISIVRERETGTLEQLMVTPLRSRELIVGKMVPFALLAFLDSGIIFLIAINWFHVPFRGSLLVLAAMALVFLVNNLGLGLLISAISRTQQEAQIVAFLLIMPSVLLSGFMFPVQNMPQIIQYLTYAIPFRYFLEIVRGLFLRGVGVSVLWPQMVALTAFGIATMLAGTLAFKKRL